MILVLVVWLLVGWVQSHQDATAPDDRVRRAHLKRRMLERLARRGMENRERERVAEELLARLESYSTAATTSSSKLPSRHQRSHHRSLQRHHARTQLPEEISFYDQMYPQLEGLQEVDDTLQEVPEYDDVEVEMESRDVLRQYLLSEIFHSKMLDRRHVLTSAEIETEQTTNRNTREARNRRKEKRRKRQEDKKRKRGKKKNKQRRRDRDFESLLTDPNITIHDIEGEKFLDCCPSKLVVVEKSVSRVPGSSLPWEIREDHRYFYERVCFDEYLGKECIFPARSLRKGVVTRCAQEYSYTQAIIRPFNTTGEFNMGHVLVRSGCSCQVSLTHKKRKRKR
ncbi:hypothetical protein SK128_014801 [Halocaridina rubra]|uniref:Uncharacterized protein n=1 Tax=Halocaridina rubra TaxID=373956 RepID=A0AAN9AGA1_HALRR